MCLIRLSSGPCAQECITDLCNDYLITRDILTSRRNSWYVSSLFVDSKGIFVINV
jgi:hypothetical protein